MEKQTDTPEYVKVLIEKGVGKEVVFALQEMARDYVNLAMTTKGVGTRRRILSPQDRLEILYTHESPGRIMKRYGIDLNTIRLIKSGIGNYKNLGGSKQNWLIFKGLHARACLSLGADVCHRRQHAYSFVEKCEDIVTSPESPSILIQRYRCGVEHLRAVKRGYGKYAQFGGCEANWAKYYLEWSDEIDRLENRRPKN